MSEKGFDLPKYGVLWSVRHRAKQSNDLINSIRLMLHSSIVWAEHLCTGGSYLENRILRKDVRDSPIYFKLHGNKFANSIEFCCKDIAVLEAIKAAFPVDFVSDVQVKEGLC